MDRVLFERVPGGWLQVERILVDWVPVDPDRCFRTPTELLGISNFEIFNLNRSVSSVSSVSGRDLD